ncbi:MAG: hypothetical protein LBK60_03150 [Verrucomicrobiales bacterium]|jgi:hypothetical protein|nr:hypothetical protein [Verrucomicrobiales bacterium]
MMNGLKFSAGRAVAVWRGDTQIGLIYHDGATWFIHCWGGCLSNRELEELNRHCRELRARDKTGRKKNA